MSAATMARPTGTGYDGPGWDGEQPDEYRDGRKFPYTTVGDWVALSGVSPRAMQVYVLLRSFVNTRRDDDRAWPGQRLLARGLGVSKAHTVGSAIAELVAVGAVDVETAPSRTGRRNIYTVHEAPPPGYTGLGSTQELIAVLAAEDAAAAEALAGRPVRPPPPGSKPARSCPATSRTRRRTGGAAGRDTAGSRQKPPGQMGSAEKTAHPPNGGPPKSLASGGCAVFSADGSAEKTAQNDLKLNDPKGEGTRARAKHPATEVVEPVHAPRPPSSQPEPRPAEAQPAAPTQTPVLGPEASWVSELGAVTAALAQVADQLTTALTAQPTAGPLATAPALVPSATEQVVLPAIAAAPAPDRPETWKCPRHLATPDPQDRPCGGCGAVRRHHEALRDLQLAQAAQKRSETAHRAREARATCTDCDDYGDIIDPDTGYTYEHSLRCNHDGHATARITRHRQYLTAQAAKATQTGGPAPGAAARAEIRAHLAELATRRTNQHTDQLQRPLRPTPKAW